MPSTSLSIASLGFSLAVGRGSACALPALLLLCAGLGVAPPSAAQQPVSSASVQALVAALSGANSGPATRSFRRTQLPDAGSNLCAEGSKPAAGATATNAAPSAGNRSGSSPAPAATGAATRNLEVVPYAGDTTPGVNLSVKFAVGSDKLASTDRQLLDNVASALRAPELASEGFAIAGHTDSSGDARINMELSCARALSVRRYLVGKGVTISRLTAYGFGSLRPLDGQDAAVDVNRRVEVRRAPQ
jgi:outer membrane protein OmpA-like peptidoglycan-associated protein